MVCWPGHYCAGVSGPDAIKECQAGVICGSGASAETVSDAAVSLPVKGYFAD